MSFPRLRIAFIAHKFGHQYGGAEAYGVELMRELAKRHDITVIAEVCDSNTGVDVDFIPIKVATYWPSWIRSYLFARAAARITQRTEHDLIHSHMNGWVGDIDILHVQSVRYKWFVRPSSWLKKISLFISPRVHMYLWLEKKRVHLRPPRRTLVVSNTLKQQLQQAYKTKYPFDVITPGVHIPLLDAKKRQKTRQQLGFSPIDTVCIQVARNPLAKGLTTILNTLSTLPNNIKLLVVGVAAKDLLVIRQKVQQQELVDRVVLIEQSLDISAYYQAADMALHPTLNDSFGMAPLEAMAYELPVIMSGPQWCGFAQYASHNHNALLLSEPENSSELQLAINRIIKDQALSSQLKQNGLLLARTFSWENIAKQVEAIYAEFLAIRIHKAMPKAKN